MFSEDKYVLVCSQKVKHLFSGKIFSGRMLCMMKWFYIEHNIIITFIKMLTMQKFHLWILYSMKIFFYQTSGAADWSTRPSADRK